jgi:hypothetical protein
MAFSKSASFTFGYSIDIEKIRIKAIAIICKYLRMFSSTSEAYNRDDLPLERIELRIFKA